MAGYRVILLIVLLTTLLCCHTSDAGPARQLASLAAGRSSKIPRSIRAPFRNTEMMTARGFGKRGSGLAYPLGLNVKDDYPWNYLKHESKYYDGLTSEQDLIQQYLNELNSESVPVDWLVEEIASNPMLAKSIVQRFIDTNKDGILTANELLTASSERNDIY